MTILRTFRDLVLRGTVLLVGSLLVACGSSSSASTASLPTGAATGGASSYSAQSIGFSPADTVLLRPGQTLTRSVSLSPPAEYDVGLALLGNSIDAALDRSAVHTTLEGIGEFAITASSVPASFDIRASLGSLTAILPVSVSDEGYATVQVSGTYTGNRKVSQWVASLRTDGPCEKFGNALPSDGSLVTMVENAPPKLRISGVPVGLAPSVVLRGDHLVWGCANLPTLTADETLELPIHLYDTAVSYGTAPIEVTFLVESNADAWAGDLSSLGKPLIDAFVQSSADDTSLLLGTMQSSLGSVDTQADFSQRRTSGNWDELLTTQWSDVGNGVECIRDALNRWFSLGASSIASGSSIDSRVSLSSTAVSLNQVQLTLESMQGLAASAWISSPQVPLAGTVDANDTLNFSTYFSFNDELFLRLLAQIVASAEYPGAADVPAALADLVRCEAIAPRLNDAAPTSATCGTSCLTQLCKTALRNLWTNTETVARSRSSSVLTLSFTCTLRLDEMAFAIGCDGTWRGIIDTPDGTSITIGGAIH